MDVIYSCCAGLDAHKKTVVVTIIISKAQGQPLKETRIFSTMTDDLLAISDWLVSYGVTHAAMESRVNTGNQFITFWGTTLKSGW
jgi:transposase